MAVLGKAKTVWVDDENWTSPDGKVTIWTIKLDIDGERDMHKTMSKALATEGWTGEVEEYTNDKGKTYVRQAPKEEKSYGQNSEKKEWQPRDDNTIRAQWAIGQAIIAVKQPDSVVTAFDIIEEHAKRFYAMVDRVKGSVDTPKPIDPEEAQARRETQRDAERLRNTLQEDTVYDPEEEQINLANLPY